MRPSWCWCLLDCLQCWLDLYLWSWFAGDSHSIVLLNYAKWFHSIWSRKNDPLSCASDCTCHCKCSQCSVHWWVSWSFPSCTARRTPILWHRSTCERLPFDNRHCPGMHWTNQYRSTSQDQNQIYEPTELLQSLLILNLDTFLCPFIAILLVVFRRVFLFIGISIRHRFVWLTSTCCCCRRIVIGRWEFTGYSLELVEYVVALVLRHEYILEAGRVFEIFYTKKRTRKQSFIVLVYHQKDWTLKFQFDSHSDLCVCVARFIGLGHCLGGVALTDWLD